MNEESTCQAIMGQYDAQLESYFEDDSTMFKDLVNDTKSMSGFSDQLTNSAILFKRGEELVAQTVTMVAPVATVLKPPPPPPRPASMLSAQQPPPPPAKPAPAVAAALPPPPPPPQNKRPNSIHNHSSSTKTPQRRVKTVMSTPPPIQASPAASASEATSIVRQLATTTNAAAAGGNKASPKSPSMPQTQESRRKNALRSTLSAFLHLHQPHMTKNEQEALIKRFDGREQDMWEMLAKRFGAGAVPARLLAGGEQALRGSLKVGLTPRPETRSETVRAMQERGLDAEVKETLLRTTTVDMLTTELQLRWCAVDADFAARGCVLALYTPGTSEPLAGTLQARDCVVDACLEYEWRIPPPRVLVMDIETNEDSSMRAAGGGGEISDNSLLGGEWHSKRPRRIQPTQVLERE